MADGDAARARERDVLAPPGRIEPLHQRGEFFEIVVVDPLGGAEREVEPMRDQRKMPGEQVEFVELLAPRVEIMIGDDFEEIDALAVGEEIGAKRGTVAQADA